MKELEKNRKRYEDRVRQRKRHTHLEINRSLKRGWPPRFTQSLVLGWEEGGEEGRKRVEGRGVKECTTVGEIGGVYKDWGGGSVSVCVGDDAWLWRGMCSISQQKHYNCLNELQAFIHTHTHTQTHTHTHTHTHTRTHKHTHTSTHTHTRTHKHTHTQTHACTRWHINHRFERLFHSCTIIQNNFYSLKASTTELNVSKPNLTTWLKRRSIKKMQIGVTSYKTLIKRAIQIDKCNTPGNEVVDARNGFLQF